MSEEILMGDRPYKPAPLSPQQKDAAFLVESPSGNILQGLYVDGDEKASYTVMGRVQGRSSFRLFVRHGEDFTAIARMLRVTAGRLEELT